MKHHPEPPLLFAQSEDRLAIGRWLAVPAAAVSAVVVAIVGAVVTWWWLGVILGAVTGVVMWMWTERRAGTAAADLLGGRDLDPAEFPRLANLVDGLSATTGEPTPDVRVIDDPGANLAVAGPSGAATMVITTGALASLDRLELEGLLATGFARIRGNDAMLASRVAVLVLGPLLEMDANGAGGPPWSRFGLDARGRRLRRLMGEQREFLCDLAAVDITRYPPALEAALTSMDQTGTSVESATWGTAHLWVAPPMPPSADRRLADALITHQRNDHRIALLAEL